MAIKLTTRNLNEIRVVGESILDKSEEAKASGVEALEEALLGLSKDVEAEEDHTIFLNIARQKQISVAYNVLKHILKGTEAKVTYKLYEPYKSMGVVSVVGKNLRFAHRGVFTNITRMASNVDIYPKLDGTVQMDFTFHGLTVVID